MFQLSIHILCCLMISSFGAILFFSPYSSHLKPAVSTMLMSGYPFVGALCFAITGILSIISGKKSTKLLGVLVVMLIFSVLEHLLAAYASVFWWKQVYSSNPGSSFSLPQSQDHIKHVKDFFKGMAMSNCWM
ncbi:PREDICTED: membrane-spanning 4-domains subfamily A member 7-like [Myotis davidii]|uniref:membrane-spanning 4-domains subfamily A member 7-like n=1 Tax=Myotis davidii TaxID=225400 RepID=UPI000766E953|nr:PREDICTED: membrane-spanning 4-domains subfamily A member 7-like [Myotis davidii]